MRKLLFAAAFMLLCTPAYADGAPTSIDAINDVVQVAKCSGQPSTSPPCIGFIDLTGTFNGCTVHWLISTDDGTTKSAYRNISATAATSTAADNFRFEWGWSALTTQDQTLFYASVSGCSSAPDLTAKLFEARQ